MIYGVFIGLVIVICGIINIWLPGYATVAIGVSATLVIIVLWAISSRASKLPKKEEAATPDKPAEPSATPQAPGRWTKTGDWPCVIMVLFAIAALIYLIRVPLSDSRIPKATPPPIRQYYPAPAAPYVPPVVVPRTVKMPEWELCEDLRGKYSYKPRIICQKVSVEFGSGQHEITITSKRATVTVFRGLQNTDEEGIFNGAWDVLDSNSSLGYGRFHLNFDPDPSLEYARGWKTKGQKRIRIVLQKLMLLRNHD